MQHITATDAKQNFAVLIEKAQREPVTITKQTREVAVVISPAEYERLRRYDIEEFQNFRTQIARDAAAKGLTPEIVEDLLKNE